MWHERPHGVTQLADGLGWSEPASCPVVPAKVLAGREVAGWYCGPKQHVVSLARQSHVELLMRWV